MGVAAWCPSAGLALAAAAADRLAQLGGAIADGRKDGDTLAPVGGASAGGRVDGEPWSQPRVQALVNAMTVHASSQPALSV